MSDHIRHTLELDQEETFRVVQREWAAERIGWFAIAAVLIAAVLGAFGPGIFSWRDVSSEYGKLRVEYYAIQRYAAPAELRISFDSPAEDFVELAISQSFVNEITPEAISPNPAEVRLEGERVVYRLKAADLGEQGRVVYRYQHDTFGFHDARISFNSAGEVKLRVFVCP